MKNLLLRVKIKLLIECFLTSTIGVLIIFLLMREPFTFLLVRADVVMMPVVLLALTITGIIQTIANDRWLKKTSSYLVPESDREKLEEQKYRYTFAIFGIIIGFAVVGFFITLTIFNLTLKYIIIYLLIAILLGAIVSFSFYFTEGREWTGQTEAIGALEEIIAFPLRSASLSFSLWVLASSIIAIGPFILGLPVSLSLYILVAGISCGCLAFPLQYLLFKNTLKELLKNMDIQSITGLEKLSFITIGIREKIFIFLCALVMFSIAFSTMMGYTRMTIVVQEAISKTEGGFLPFLARSGGFENILALDKGKGFVVDYSGKSLISSPSPETLTNEMVEEMKKKGSGFLRASKRNDLFVFHTVPEKNAIMGFFHPEDELSEITSGFRSRSFYLFIITLFLCAIVAILTARDISGPIKKLVASTKNISKGDFSSGSLTISEDETMELTSSVKAMSDSIKNQMSIVQHISGEIFSALDTVLPFSEEFSTNVASQSATISLTTSTIEELSQIARQIDDNASQVSSVAGEALSAGMVGQQAMTAFASGMEDIKASMQRISEAMNKLSTKAQQIGYIVEVIDDVADKSDVLSLNAALEGIRAGEVGKGFIIVADEMRKLAVDVLGSTKEIRELIKQIQDACSEAVLATKSGVKTTQQGADMTSSVEKSFEKILEHIKKTSDSVKQISVSTHEQRGGTDHIVNSMNEMAEISEKSVSGVQMVVESLSRLSDLAKALMKRLQ